MDERSLLGIGAQRRALIPSAGDWVHQIAVPLGGFSPELILHASVGLYLPDREHPVVANY